MTSLPATLALVTESVERLFGYGSIVFDDIFSLSKSAASKALSGSEVAGLVKPAVSKAAGVVVDDMAVVSDGVNESEIAQHRETAIWLKIVAGSFVNKAIITAMIFAAGVTFPIVPEIMLGIGACYLAIEGAHKVLEFVAHLKYKVRPSGQAIEQIAGWVESEIASPPRPARFMNAAWMQKALAPFRAAMNRFLGDHPKERAVLKDLLILDGILSTEILLMANSTLKAVPFDVQVVTLAVVSIVITLGVYGIVYAIIRADNVAESLCNPDNRLYSPKLAGGILFALPYALNAISVIGTIAMLGVAGGVAAHLLPALLNGVGLIGVGGLFAGLFHGWEETFVHALPAVGKMLFASLVGFGVGALLILTHGLAQKVGSLVRGKS